LDATFLWKWATAYEKEELFPGCLEDRLFTSIGPAAKTRGYLTKNDLEQIGTWKSRGRNNHLLNSNTDADIETLTGMALGAPDHLRHCVLSILDGVRTPMASAILTVVDPDRFTVIDVRAISPVSRVLGMLPKDGERVRHRPTNVGSGAVEVECFRDAVSVRVPISNDL
jgi:hypothetical protein